MSKSIVKYALIFGAGILSTVAYYSWHNDSRVDKAKLTEYIQTAQVTSQLEQEMLKSREKERELLFKYIVPEAAGVSVESK